MLTRQKLPSVTVNECIDLQDDDDDLNYFSQLPVEVIENILCRLPTSDLLLNVSLICSQWKTSSLLQRYSLSDSVSVWSAHSGLTSSLLQRYSLSDSVSFWSAHSG